VGLIHTLYSLKQFMPTKTQLAADAIRIERDILCESVGSQDQVSAAYGGFNRISFSPNGDFETKTMILDGPKLVDYQNHLMLFYTGLSRTASKVAEKQIENTRKKTAVLAEMYKMVDAGIACLLDPKGFEGFGKLLDGAWQLKKSLTEKISTKGIDQIYESAKSAGALGGKIIGAGGGGFMLLFARPGEQARVRETLKKLLYVPFRFETTGSQIVFYRPNARKSDRPPSFFEEHTFQKETHESLGT
jgi:D-glycero-alpha-D-manno-heptose-7-phosphate kinase